MKAVPSTEAVHLPHAQAPVSLSYGPGSLDDLTTPAGPVAALGNTAAKLYPAPVVPLPDLSFEMMPLSGGGAEPGPLHPDANKPPPDFSATTTALFSEIEQHVIDHMKRYSIRAAQVAIARHGELKHAVALTWAEPEYPITLPTTRMRIGSISKTITAFAMMRLAELSRNPANGYPEIRLFSSSPTDNVGALLGIPQGNTPQQNWEGWHQRSVAHLLCHLGYFDEEVVVDPDEIGTFCDYWRVANALGKVPTGGAPFIDRHDMVDYIRQEAPPDGYFESVQPPALSTNPQLQSPTQYSGFGYERVGDIIGELAHQYGGYPDPNTAYEDWVLEHIFEPLGTDRPRLGVETAVQARSQAQDHQFDEETLYHPAMPVLSGSAWQAWEAEGDLVAYPWAATAYEGHNYRLGLAAGQWSLAAVDYARLLSSVDVLGGGVLTEPLSVERLIERSYARNHSLGFFLREVPKPGQPVHAQVPETGFGTSKGSVEAGGKSTVATIVEDRLVSLPVGESGGAWSASSEVGPPAPAVARHTDFVPPMQEGFVPYGLGDGLPKGPPTGGDDEPYHVAWHNGGWVGTQALAFRRDDGVVVVVIYNGNPVDLVDASEIDTLSDMVAHADDAWPDDDLFPYVMPLWPGGG